jgi:hypothetical protein
MKPYPISPMRRGFFLAMVDDAGVGVVGCSGIPSTKDPYPKGYGSFVLGVYF